MRRLDPTTRRELLSVLAFTMTGGVLRLWGFGGLGLSHFDEGIYALSGLWSVTPGDRAAIDPMVIPYAPPGFPILVGIGYLAFGLGDASAILVSTLCGIAAIPACAWVGRRTFGPGAGAAAAALSATSMAHVAFSRKALTDAPFLLAWLLAIGLGGRFLERPTFGRAIAAGLAVGLAQNIKYNGWLLGLVIAGGAAIGLAREPSHTEGPMASTGRVLRVSAMLLLAGAVALLLYVPWYAFVERHGGYAGLVRHHRGYLGGPASWLPFWRQQLGHQVALSGGPVWDASRWALAWLAAAWATRADITTAPARMLAGFLGGAVLSGGLANLGWWVGLAAAPCLLIQGRPAARMLGAWWLLLSILTPFYLPYARLWLPLGAAGWLLVAGSVVVLIPRRGQPESAVKVAASTLDPFGSSRRLVGAVLVATLIGVWQQWHASPEPFPFRRLFQGTSALKTVVQDLPRVVPEGSEIHVLARRPLAFYLLIQGRYRFRLLSGVEAVSGGSRAPGWTLLDEAALDPEARGRIESLPAESIYREWLDPVTLLDVAPGSAFRESERGPLNVRLLRRRPESPRSPPSSPTSPASHSS